MRSLKKPTMLVGATAVLALALSWASPAFAADAPTPPVTDTTVSAPATPTPSSEPTATQTPAPKTDAPSAPADVAPAAPEPAPANTNTAPDGSSKPAVAVKVAAATLPSPPSSPTTPKKVFVCKYVGTPNVNERLQTGQNPISVSIKAIKNWDGTLPGYFADAQGRSYVLAYDNGQAKPDVSACPTPVVVCANSGSLTWTKDAHLSTATVTLKKGFDSCDVSLNSYETQGATWETSGNQTFVDHATVHLTKNNPTATLTVKVQGCFQQQDLYIGTTRYDGKDGALPHYPNSSTPAGLIDHWNGAADCTPPPPTDVCKNIAGDQTTVPAGFVQSGENCVPVHNVCSTSTVDASVWTTEDGAPTVGTDGIDFSTPTASDKVNYFGRTLNVPFAGISGGSYTVKNTGGPIAAYDFEVWQNGTSSFATVVFEPYVNGLTGTGTSGDGTFHMYTITPDSLVWNSKIVSGEGSQAQPVTLTRMQELIPSATLIRAGLGQGRNNAGSLSTVSSFTDPACGYTEFPKLPPIPTVTPENVMFHDGCGVTDDSYTVPGTLDGTPSVFNDPITGDVSTLSSYSSSQGGYTVVDKTTKAGVRTVQVTFVQLGNATIAEPGADDTYTIVTIEGHKYAQWTYTFDSTPCPLTIIATPPAPVVNPATCTADGSLPALKDGEGYTAAYNRPFDGPGAYTAVYTAVKGATFKDGTTVSYDLTVAAKQVSGCPTTPPTHPVTPAGNGGVNTGLSGSEPGAHSTVADFSASWGFGGLAAAIIAAIALFMVFRPKRNHELGEAGVEKP